MTLKQIFNAALAVIAKKNFTPVIWMLYYDNDNKQFVMTDSITIVVVKFELKVDSSFMIPYEYLSQLVKMSPNFGADWEFKLSNWKIIFNSFVNWELTFDLPDVWKYPNYLSVIPTIQDTVDSMIITQSLMKVYKAQKVLWVAPTFNVMKWSILMYQEDTVTILTRLSK